MVHYQSFYSLQSSYLCEMSISHKYGHLSGPKKKSNGKTGQLFTFIKVEANYVVQR